MFLEEQPGDTACVSIAPNATPVHLPVWLRMEANMLHYYFQGYADAIRSGDNIQRSPYAAWNADPSYRDARQSMTFQARSVATG